MNSVPMVAYRVVPASLLFLALRVGATSMLAEDLTSMSTGADVIVQGTVKTVESRWVGDAPQKIITTRVVIEVTDVLKGAPAGTITLVEPGGRVGDIAQRVDGVAEFAPGEEVMVFLDRRGGDIFGVHGMAQGKFRVERSSDGKMTFVVPSPTASTEIVDPTTGLATQSTSKPTELKAFRKEVRAALKAQTTRPPPKDRP